MPKPATGTVVQAVDPKDGVLKWHTRPRTPAGRKLVPLDGVPLDNRALAKEVAALVSKDVKARAAVAPGTKELVDEYAGRWLKSRTGKIGTVDHDETHLRLHAFSVPVRSGTTTFGKLLMGEVSREDIEDVVIALDARVTAVANLRAITPQPAPGLPRLPRFGWKTAQNVWATLTKLFDDAKNHKDRTLRARADNPCAEVRGPDRGDKKAKAFLYPSEFLKLVRCPLVPVECREVYAALVYGYFRVGEYEALLREDVDLEHGTIAITKAVERATRTVKSTKSGETRTIPIEANARALWARLVDRRLPLGKRARGHFWIPDAEDRAVGLREHLRLAGVTRAALFTDDARQKHITAHDLRATGITWAAVRGDNHLAIMERAGHGDAATSLLYIRTAQNLRDSFGEVFPELPEELTGIGPGKDPQSSQVVDITVEQRGIEPVPAPTASARNDNAIVETAAVEPATPGVTPESSTQGMDQMLAAVAAAMTAGRFDLAQGLLEAMKARV